MSQDFESINPLKITIKNQDRHLKFDCIIHPCNKVLIIELEHTISEEAGDFFSFYHSVKKSIAKMQNAASLRDMCQIIVKKVQNITGFDRVMIYQFDSEQTGKVIAEEKLESLNPYLDLHYPDSGIPDQAKKLYILNRLRLIPDINSQPINMLSADNSVTN